MGTGEWEPSSSDAAGFPGPSGDDEPRLRDGRVIEFLDIDELERWMRRWGEAGIRIDGDETPALLVVGKTPGAAYQVALDRKADDRTQDYRSVVLTTAVEMKGIDTVRLIDTFNRESGSVVASLDDEGDLRLRMDAPLDHGVTASHLRSRIEDFKAALGTLRRLHEQQASGTARHLKSAHPRGVAGQGMTSRSEVIVEIGAELGSLTLHGLRTPDGWVFSRHVLDQTPELMDEGQIGHDSETVRTWEDALGLLNRYPWHQLYPVTVHPEFRQRVLSAVLDRAAKDPGARKEAVKRWKRICDPKADLF